MENIDYLKIFETSKTITEVLKKLNKTDNSKNWNFIKILAENVGFDLNLYKKKKIIKNCENCSKELKKGQTKFCSRNCSATHNNKGRIVSDITKEKIRNTLTKEKNEKKCPICGQNKCLNSDVCRHTKKWFNNLSYFGFNLETIGTILIYNEYYRIKEIMLKEYYDNQLSPYDISIKYGYDKSFENLLHILKSFGVKSRNLSESNINARLNGKLSNIIKENTNYQFKYGWHTTWENKKIFYRSSYELDFFLNLDEKKIPYEVEYFRIKYWDSIKCKYRVAIPDVYIINDKKIIEIKSKITFNKQNIIDKFKEYVKLGFDVRLILEKKEYNFNEVLNIEENNFLIESFR